MNTFSNMGLPESLCHTLQHMQFNEPTPIQDKVIPLALEGKDILGSAQTGTGKTGAFGIPLIARLLSNTSQSALVMTPTRELATQVMSQLQAMLGRKSKIKTALLIGGEAMPKQFSQLRLNPRLVVGTPGRINDHLKRESLDLKTTDLLVLDETDRMLDMGFTIQIEEILKHMEAERQTLLFSATLPENIVRISQKYLKNPINVSVSAPLSPAANVSQSNLHLSEAEKYDTLVTELNEREGSVIIFVKTKYGTEKMAIKLTKQGHSAQAIHGDLKQNRRDRVITAFRKQKYRILVATDIAARGLDIPHIEHVINYDLPQCPEDYIHRIGRTARAGAKGYALNFVTSADNRKWDAIDRLLNPDAPRAQRKSSPKRENGKERGKGRIKAQPEDFIRFKSNLRNPRKSFREAEPSNTRSSDKPYGTSNSKANDRGSNKAYGSSNSKANDRGSNRAFGSSNGKANDRGSNKAYGSSNGKANDRGSNKAYGSSNGKANDRGSNKAFGSSNGKANDRGSNKAFGSSNGKANDRGSNKAFGSSNGKANDRGSNKAFGSSNGKANDRGSSKAYGSGGSNKTYGNNSNKANSNRKPSFNKRRQQNRPLKAAA